jgi:hypothetical protein
MLLRVCRCRSVVRSFGRKVPVQPVGEHPEDLTGHLELRSMPDPGEDGALPAEIAGRGLADGGHRHQPVFGTADEQHRDGRRGHRREVAARTADHPHQGPGRGQERFVAVRGRLALDGQRDRRRDHRGIGPGRDGEAEIDNTLDGLARRLA